MFECLSRWCDIPKRSSTEGVFGVCGGRCDSAKGDCKADWRCTFCSVGQRTVEGHWKRRFMEGLGSSLSGVVLTELICCEMQDRHMNCVLVYAADWVSEDKESELGEMGLHFEGNVMKQDLKRHILPQGLSAPLPATSSPLRSSVWTSFSPSASNDASSVGKKKKEEMHHRSL